MELTNDIFLKTLVCTDYLQNVCNKEIKSIDLIYFYERVKKLINILQKISFSLLRGVSGTPPNTLTLWFGQMFNNFSHRSWLFFFYQFKKNYTTSCWYCSIMFFFYCKALNNNGNKWILLDVNPRTEFLTYHKFQRPKNKKSV